MTAPGPARGRQGIHFGRRIADREADRPAAAGRHRAVRPLWPDRYSPAAADLLRGGLGDAASGAGVGSGTNVVSGRGLADGGRPPASVPVACVSICSGIEAGVGGAEARRAAVDRRRANARGRGERSGRRAPDFAQRCGSPGRRKRGGFTGLPSSDGCKRSMLVSGIGVCAELASGINAAAQHSRNERPTTPNREGRAAPVRFASPRELPNRPTIKCRAGRCWPRGGREQRHDRSGPLSGTPDG